MLCVLVGSCRNDQGALLPVARGSHRITYLVLVVGRSSSKLLTNLCLLSVCSTNVV
ncbi:unnamed protein product [Brassica rapa]|uniref:Uncharacterized protein n=2 Tax=Brassica TaxID=3705 RepID=A0A8D9GC96_BRACM|nr:unnamed protein product [Brassica napus]CAG7877093.1 unnamed protein product [Brassica rapa]